MTEYNQGFPRSFSRSQTKSIWLLVLSFIPLCGCLIAVVVGVKGSRVDDKPLHLTFRISDSYYTLNNALTVIGIFHALVGYAIRQLMDRVATQLRTRAFLDNSASTAQLLNSLPGSPDWRVFFKSHIARSIRYVGLFSGFISIAGGVLYKQGIVLSSVLDHNDTTYPHVFVTNCTANFTHCYFPRYYAYGVALDEARRGGQFSVGVEEDFGRRVLTFVSAPWVPQITTPVGKITTIHAKTFAMVSEYRNATLDELPTNKRAMGGVSSQEMAIRVAFYGQKDVDWSFSASNLSDGTNRSVLGRTYYCVAECEWSTKNDSLVLDSYSYIDCSPLSLGAPSNVSAQGIAHALFSDIANWEPENVLDLAYVVPAMYATIVLGQWDGLWGKLANITAVKPLLTDTLDTTQTLKVLVIESNKHFVAYIVFIVLIFIALWISGFVDTKAFVSEWAPLWFGLLSDSEQEDIRKQIRNNMGLEGLEEIGSEYIPLTLNDLEETTDS